MNKNTNLRPLSHFLLLGFAITAKVYCALVAMIGMGCIGVMWETSNPLPIYAYLVLVLTLCLYLAWAERDVWQLVDFSESLYRDDYRG